MSVLEDWLGLRPQAHPTILAPGKEKKFFLHCHRSEDSKTLYLRPVYLYAGAISRTSEQSSQRLALPSAKTGISWLIQSAPWICWNKYFPLWESGNKNLCPDYMQRWWGTISINHERTPQFLLFFIFWCPSSYIFNAWFLSFTIRGTDDRVSAAKPCCVQRMALALMQPAFHRLWTYGLP